MPPLEASVQYVLMESHPLLRPRVEGGQHISASETGLQARFRGAQGFVLSGAEPLAWSVLRLEALRTTSFAVRTAHHVFFLSADGNALGESQIAIDNQGSPDLVLPMRAEPTFASLEGEAMLLTRSEGGDLWLPLSPGPQQVLVQHRQRLLDTVLVLVYAELWLPQLAAPATQATVELRTPQEWVPLYAEMAPESRLLAFALPELLLLLALCGWTERVLAALSLSRGRRVLLAGMLSVAAVLSSPLLALLLAANAGLTLAWALPQMRRIRWTLARLVVLAALGAALMGTAGLLVHCAASPVDSAPVRSEASTVRNLAQEPTESPTGTMVAGAYQGLPARVELPPGARQMIFAREMLATQEPQAVRALLLPRRALRLLAALVALLAVGLVLSQHRAL